MRLVYRGVDQPLKEYEVQEGQRIVAAFLEVEKTLSLHDAVKAWRQYSDETYCCMWLAITNNDKAEQLRKCCLPYLVVVEK